MRHLIIALFTLLSFSATTSAQGCIFGDDGFDVGCCNTVQPNLPNLPGVSIQGKYGCLRNCNQDGEYLVQIGMAAPQMIACDYASIPIGINGVSPGAPGFSGTLLAKYSRTWVETNPPRPPSQRYRFLVNGDLLPVTNGASPCPYPATVVSPLRPMHVSGHIDYICEATSSQGWTVKMSLTYFEGCISHAPWSTRPLAAAPNVNRSYHVVAPSSFVFMPVAEPAGPITAEAIRSSTLSLAAPAGVAPYSCNGEADVVQGMLQSVNQRCPCATGAGGPFRWVDQTLTGTAVCGGVTTSFSTPPLPAFPTPTGLGAHPLGKWPEPLPGMDPEHLSVYFGVIVYTDPCQPNGSPVHVVTGVGTSCTFGELFPLGTQLSGVFLDLQNSETFNPATGSTMPTWGAPFISTIVWNLNLL